MMMSGELGLCPPVSTRGEVGTQHLTDAQNKVGKT